MHRLKNTGLVLCGLVLGLSLSSPAAQAVESLKATLSTNRILVDGKDVRLTAYNINGNNYVMLRDIGRAVGFNVYWDSDAKCVQVESGKPYTGEAPVTSAEAKPVEQPAQPDVATAEQDIIDRQIHWRKYSQYIGVVPRAAAQNALRGSGRAVVQLQGPRGQHDELPLRRDRRRTGAGY